MKKLLGCCFLLSFAAAAQPVNKPVMSIDSLFQSYFKPGEPGGAVLLVKNNRVIYE